ncbi:MAG: hypothetical protein GY850_23480 [bacterium]|nr:hypothetical protein [bacterium]
MKDPEKMHFRIGAPVTGTNFFPRPDIVKELTEALEGDHVLLLAPRRTGKTSILYHLKESPPENSSCFSINLEKFKNPDQWLAAMLGELLKEQRFHKSLCAINKGFQIIVEQCNRIEEVNIPEIIGLKLGQAVGKDWQQVAEKLLRKLTELDHPIYFLLDEFPILVNHMAKTGQDVEGMLRWFRDWRLNYETRQVKFLVTGSIGLDSIVRRLGLQDTINDFHTVELPPLTSSQAHEFINRLAADNAIAINAASRNKILDLVGAAWPYFLQIFLLEIKTHQRKTSKALTPDSLKQIYWERMIAGQRNKYLPHMFDRLKTCFTANELKVARELLKQCSRDKQGLTRDRMLHIYKAVITDSDQQSEEQLNYVLDVLKHDGYLTQSLTGQHRTRFFSNMLRDYWQRKVTA